MECFRYFLCSPMAPILSTSCSLCYGHTNLLPYPQAECFQTCLTESMGLFIVTGGNRGVGFQTAKILLQMGHRVYILSRDACRGTAAVSQLQTATGSSRCEAFQVDLSDLQTVKRFAALCLERGDAVRGIVNNGGIISNDAMVVNHVGHFALTLAIIPLLRKSVVEVGQAVVVNVASCAHMDGSLTIADALSGLVDIQNHGSRSRDAWTSYTQSKAANALFSLAFSNVLRSSGIQSFSYHPGVMLTDLWTADRAGSGSNGGQEALMKDLLQACLCPCVKHPMIAAVGAVSLVSPRWCYRCFCIAEQRYPQPRVGHEATAELRERDPYLCGASILCSEMRTLQRCICTGDSGGYYQQCCCLCTVPVRMSPLLYSVPLQEELWRKSMNYITRESPDMYELVREYDYRAERDFRQGCSLISPAWPCTECFAIAPYCVCMACLC